MTRPGSKSVSRSVVVQAPAQEVFALLEDPRRHPDFDGSGTVRSSLSAPPKLSKGATFGMKMRLGLPYTITNEVVEFDQDRVIAWRHFGGHIWRYQLEPAGEGTRVTETFDWSTARAPKLLELLRYPSKNTDGIEKTLERLKTLVEQ